MPAVRRPQRPRGREAQAAAPQLPLGAASPAAPARPRDADPLRDFFYRSDEEGPDLGLSEQLDELGATVEEARVEYLSFWLADEEYAVPLRLIREIQKPPPITEVPRAAPHVLGVITLRGEVLPVFDPHLRLGLTRQPEGRGSRVVIVDVGEGACGILIDRVGDVVRLAASQIEGTPPGIGGAEGELLAGVGRDEGRMLILLELAALLRLPGAGGGRS